MATKVTNEDLLLAANTIRGLAMDGVQKARSGHPGMPMGMADVAAVLFLKHLVHCPTDPEWPDRDRFVLSAGHGSMLLYSLLHLSGYDLPLSELQAFRQWESKTPGHPEAGHTPGVETTTGPLGQGCGNAVGMALAERMLAARFNTPEIELVDHYTYAICGDGDLMEGVSHEAFSLAGHLGLAKLILFYDCNRITIEGSTDLAYSDNVKRRFQGYNWGVIEIDGHNHDEINRALRRARRDTMRPTIIITHSHIAHGSPNKHDTASAHGEPLGDEEIQATRANLGLPDEAFHVPDAVRELFAARLRSVKRKRNAWNRRFKAYAADHPEKAAAWNVHMNDILPDNLEDVLPQFDPAKAVATRSASGTVIQAVAGAVPQLVGGAADLAPSTKTLISEADSVGPGQFAGRNLHFGIREHGMGSVMNGMALHGGLRVYGSTFFVFTDYFRPAIRLAAMMRVPVIYVLTHDSFFVGEDGPTHQPVEHLAALRCIPGLTVIRPGDPTETAAAWAAALKNKTGPSALILTRQNLPVIDRETCPPASDLEKGAYTVCQSAEGTPQLLLLASGSEVALALDAARELANECIVRVVSMPSWELFEQQDAAYRDEVLPPACHRRVVLEAASSMGWEKYAGKEGKILAMDHFGASAPYAKLAEEFGFSAENVVAVARDLLMA